MVVAIAEAGPQCEQALVPMADDELVGHANGAVKLNGLVADELRCIAGPDLGDRDGAATRVVGLLARERRRIGERASFLAGNPHVGDSMLKGLKGADRNAELLASLHIV